MTSGELPLKNVTVIDCASLGAGPLAATFMGDFGSEVIKIEHPEYGDALRQHGEDGLYWKARSRNKKSVPIDLHAEEGQALVRELVREADVFIENFRPGRLEEWNLGWEDLAAVNEDLVMVRTTGFGQYGPYKDLPGFGTLAESMSGFAYLTGWPDKPPTLPPFGLADSIAAMHSTFAVMFALYWRDVEGGTGQYIDTSILEPIFRTLMASHAAEYDAKGIVRERMGNRIPSTAPRNTYETKDGRHVAISTSAESIAERVLRLVGGDELVHDPRFETMQDRVENVEELDAIIQERMSHHSREEAIEAFREIDAAIAPIYNIEDIFADEHFRERDALIEVGDGDLGDLTLPAVTPKLSETPGRVEHTGPPLGHHAREVLVERTSITPGELEDLDAAGVVRLGN